MKPGYYLDQEGEILPIHWKTPYNYDTDEEALRTGLLCEDPSLTQQSQAEGADINTIVRNFGVTGTVPTIPLPPNLADVEEFDFQTAMNIVAQGKASFMQLPAEVRDAFHHDPNRFVHQVDQIMADQDEGRRGRNMDVLRAWGLAVTPGPKADRTTLGDVLAAIKASGPGGASPATLAEAKGPKGP